MPSNKELIGKKTKAIPKEKKEFGIDVDNKLQLDILDSIETDSLDTSVLESFSNVSQTREEIYSLIDMMSQDNLVSAVLETYTEDVTETNDSGRVMWCESNNSDISTYVNEILDSINVDKNTYSWTFNLLKYGDIYLKLIRESEVEDDLLFNNEDRTLNENIYLDVPNKEDKFVYHVEMVSNPGEMFELQKYGKTKGYIKAPVTIQKNFTESTSLNSLVNYKMKKKDVTVYSATDFVHACLQENTNRCPEEVSIFRTEEDEQANNGSTYTVKRGQSLLYNHFKTWREMSLLKNSVLLNRITKSAIVRILNVDIGDMPKEKVDLYMNRLRDAIKQKSALNINHSMSDYTNPGPIDNIIISPTHGTQGTITPSVIGGDVTTDNLKDLDTFQNDFFGGLRVPKQYFGQTDDAAGFNGGASLSIISSRYGKAIKQVQNKMCQLITDLVNIYLYDRGLTAYINNFSIKMQTPVTQEEIDRRESMRNKIGVVNDIINQISDVVDDKVIKLKIVKSLVSEVISNTEVVSLLQDQIDKLEQEQAEDSTKEETSKEDSVEEMPSEDDMVGFDRIPDEDFQQEEPIEQEVEEPTEEEETLPSAEELGVDLISNI